MEQRGRVVGQKHLGNGPFHMVRTSRPLAALSLASGLRMISCQATVTVGNIFSNVPLFFQANHFLRSGIQINENPHQKGKPTAASGESSVLGFFLALLPGRLPPQALVLEGRRQKLESWLIKAN